MAKRSVDTSASASGSGSGEDTFRTMALALEGATEGAHMGHPDFRAHGRIFATLRGDRATGMVNLTPEQQEQFVRAHAGFAPESGAWGRQGSTRVTLAVVEHEVLGEAITLAWQNAAARAQARASGRKKPR